MPLQTFKCVLILCCWFAGSAAAQNELPVLPQVSLETTYAPPTGSSIAVKAGDNLQSALNAAKPGDEIVLEAGATFTGNFVLPKKTGSDAWITIRSSRMDSLPGPGMRVRPENAAAMPKIVTGNSSAALKTEPGAHHYRIMGVEIAVAPGVKLNYMVVFLGDGKTVEELPTDIVFDRVYVHGAVLCHCKNGITLNSRRTAVIDSYISEIHSIDQDTQALLGYNGPGPFKIVNNYLEASGENIMFGGASATIPGLVPSDIEFRRNYLNKPERWRSSIIPPPDGLRAMLLTGGTLASGAIYYYTVTAIGPGDYVPDLSSSPAAEVSVTPVAGQGRVALSWSTVSYGDSTDARVPTEYRVYRTADPPGAKTRNWTYFSVPAPDLSMFIDTGEGGAAQAPGSGRRWMVKNLFELKNAQRVLVDSNVLEHSWFGGQAGNAFVIIPRIEGGAMPWAVTGDLTITNNLIRHAGGGLTLYGQDDVCRHPATPNLTCQQSRRALLRNNIVDDIDSTRWGGYGMVVMLQNTVALTIDRNTAINNKSSMYMWAPNSQFALTNNIMGGEVITDGYGGSTQVLAKCAPGAVFAGNVVARAAASQNTAFPNNHFVATFDAVGFVDLAGGDYRLRPGSKYRGTATDGGDPGADIAAASKAVAGVIEGRSTPSAAPVIASVLNGANFSAGPLAPGSVVVVFGADLAGGSYFGETDPLPRDLGDTVLTINDIRAPLLAADNGRIQAQLPLEISPGPSSAVVTVAGVSSAPFLFEVAPASPGLYAFADQHALAINMDNTLNLAVNPAPAHSVLTVFLTGQGAVNPAVGTGIWAPDQPYSLPIASVYATIGGQPAEIWFAGLTPRCVGIFQVNMMVPDLPPGEYPLVITIGGIDSNTATVSIS